MERRISFKNLYLVGIISLGLIGLGVESTFAMFTASAEISDPISLTSGLNYQDDIVDLVDMTISSNKVETATLNITNNTDKTLNYTSWYKTNNDNLQIGTVVSNNKSVTGTIQPNETIQIIVSIRNRGTGVAKVTVGISASESDIVVSDKATTLPTDPLPPYLNDYISNLYNGATKSTVTNNNITYNYATDVGLMNDRLGSADTDIDGGNIRYYGASPNNYIDIGDRDANDDPIFYRIIGVFDNKVKVIRNESIGNYSWDTSDESVNDGYGINEWSEADVMKLLNPGYNNESVGGSLYWNSESGNCYIGNNNNNNLCDFSNNGLSNNIKKLISSEIWNSAGINQNEIELYANQYYTLEKNGNVVQNPRDGHTRTTLWTGKIGLMYLSDYAYSVDFEECNLTADKYNDTSCKENTWIASSDSSQWLMNAGTNGSTVVWSIYYEGNIGQYRAYQNIANVRPTFYLIENTVLESGTGTVQDPFVID